jgi:hypothetical protein
MFTGWANQLTQAIQALGINLNIQLRLRLITNLVSLEWLIFSHQYHRYFALIALSNNCMSWLLFFPPTIEKFTHVVVSISVQEIETTTAPFLRFIPIT